MVGMDATAQLNVLIERYSPAVARDARLALELLKRRMPTAFQLVYDNYNALAIGFAASEKASSAILSVALYPRYVTLFFLDGATLPDPLGLLEGKGSRVRRITLSPVSRLQTPGVGALIDAAIANGAPLPKTPGGRLIIKSVSARQRPRRPSS